VSSVAFDKAVSNGHPRGCGGHGLWKFNQFLPQKHCQKRDWTKTLLLMLIDMVVLGFICVILAPVGPFFKTTVQSLLRRLRLIHAIASAA